MNSTALTANLKLLALFQLLVGGGLALMVSIFWDFQLGASFAIGALLMLTNVGAIAWTSWRMLSQKSIAWTSLIIVIKYAVLLGSIIVLAKTSWFSSLGAGLGVTSFLIAALLLAVFNQKKEMI